MDTKPISVTKVNQAGSRFVILEMPGEMAAVLILKCEDDVWVSNLSMYITMDGLETLKEALDEFVAQRDTKETPF